MKQFLEEFVIVGKDGTLRRLDRFEPGVNIVTGVGSKGKSTIIHIFEYCLGARLCRIPVGRVREYAAWFFLVLNVRDVRVVIGRCAPRSTEQTSEEAFFDCGPKAMVPLVPEANISVNSACIRLGELLRFPASRFKLGTDGLEYGRVEVADLMPLLIQYQNLIATNELFAKPDGRHGQERRTEILKIALQVISPELLSLRATKEQINKHKQTAIKQNRKLAQSHHTMMQGFQALWHNANALGLLPDRRVESIEQVRSAVELLQSESAPVPTAAGLSSNAQQLAALEAQSSDVRRSMRRISDELRHVAEIQRAVQEFEQSVDVEDRRMRVVELLGTPARQSLPCPLCGSTLGAETENYINEMQANLTDELAYARSIPPELTITERALRSQLDGEKTRLAVIEGQIRDLRQQQLAPTLTQELKERERLIGAFQQSLRMALSTQSFAERDDDEVAKLDSQLEEIDAKIRAELIGNAERDVSKRLSDRLTALARGLSRMDVAGAILEFSPSFTTILRISESKRQELSLLGGAEQLVMYHLCAILALHEELLERSFVPPLVFLDQPSQAFFPADSDKEKVDRKALLAIYDMLFRFSELHNGKIQFVILEHAEFSAEGEERFREATKYKWHGDEGLVI